MLSAPFRHRARSVLLPAAVLACVAGTGCPRRPSAAPARPARDADYLAALAVADEFCEAWRRGDVPTGKLLLSRRAQRAFPDARIHDAIAGAPSPQHTAFELSDGSRGPDGSFRFRLRLHYRFQGQAQERIESHDEQIVLTADDAGAWRVDRFPLLEDVPP